MQNDAQRDHAIRPPNQTFRPDVPHPSECCSNPYSQDIRELAVHAHLNGTDQQPIQQLQQDHMYPHPDTVSRYVARYHEFGHARAFRRTGNARSEREVKGIDMILLALYRAVLPKATANEINAFLHAMNNHDPTFRIYLHSQICRAQKRLNLTQKDLARQPTKR